jgi:hypothetical protein
MEAVVVLTSADKQSQINHAAGLLISQRLITAVGIPRTERCGRLLSYRLSSHGLSLSLLFKLYSSFYCFACHIYIRHLNTSNFSSFSLQQFSLFFSSCCFSFFSLPPRRHTSISIQNHDKTSRYYQMYFNWIPDQGFEIDHGHFLHLYRSILRILPLIHRCLKPFFC